MRGIYLFGGIAVIAMVFAVGYGLSHGSLLSDTRQIAAIPWGFVTLIDVYVGLFLFSGWILWRERAKRQALLWVALLVTLGNVATAAYVLKAAYQSKGDIRHFWLGQSTSVAEH